MPNSLAPFRPPKPERPGALRRRHPGPRQPRRPDHAARIQNENRPATAEEQRALARWSGWGAVPEVFDDRRAELRLGPRPAAAPAHPGRSRRRCAATRSTPTTPTPARSRPSGRRHRARLHRRPGPGAGLRQRELHRLRPGRRAHDRGRTGPGHRRDRRRPVPRRHDHPPARSPTPGSRTASFDLVIGNVPFGQVNAARPAA